MRRHKVTPGKNIRYGDRVSHLDEHGTPRWGIAVSTERDPSEHHPWPTVLVRYDNPRDGRYLWAVPARDVEHATNITDTTGCRECGSKT